MKKYNLMILLTFLIFLCFFNMVRAKEVKVVCIDPGHGGIDPGAYYASVKEKDINLAISLKLKDTLLKKYSVILTRDGDYDLASKGSIRRKRSDLYNRSKLINNSSCDIYLSVHLNADKNTSWYGAQVFYDDINKNNVLLAGIIQNQFKKELKSRREVKEIKDGYLYRNVKVPGVLIEAGFLSNPYERSNLVSSEYQEKMVKLIYKSIDIYFEKYY